MGYLPKAAEEEETKEAETSRWHVIKAHGYNIITF